MRSVFWILSALALIPQGAWAEEPCLVCSACETHADCGSEGLCVDFPGRKICTRTCTDSCPGDAACWKMMDPSGGELGFCLSPRFEDAFCPADYICGAQETADVQPSTTKTGASLQTCRYDGPPTALAASCPESDMSLPCEAFRLANAERVASGLKPLVWKLELAQAAQLHAIDMLHCDFFSHGSLDGRTFSSRAADVGYKGFPSAENIAAGQDSAKGVIETWMNSPGHRANLLDPENTEIGIGYWKSDSDVYGSRWVQVFGRPL